MALTKQQQITLYQVLGVPFSSSVGKLQDRENLLTLMYNPTNSQHLTTLRIQDRLTELESDADTLADLADCLDQWYAMQGDSTQMDGGGVGATTGVSFDLTAERNMLRERIITIVPFTKSYMAEEIGRMQRQNLNISVIH